MPRLNVENLDYCEMCGLYEEVSKDKKTGELLCDECLTVLSENEKMTETQQLKEEIKKCQK